MRTIVPVPWFQIASRITQIGLPIADCHSVASVRFQFGLPGCSSQRLRIAWRRQLAQFISSNA
eukprot:10866950-Alexandrium_andersonii.AAC.1